MDKDYNTVELMSENRIGRSVKRISLEILEDAGGIRNVLLGGIKQRGLLMARKIATCIAEIEGLSLPVFSIDTDDSQLEVDCNWTDESRIIVIDDVIFSGKTMFEALKRITTIQMPANLSTAVLIDRGHRQVPVDATYVGMHIPTKVNEHISVHCEGNKINKVILNTN